MSSSATGGESGGAGGGAGEGAAGLLLNQPIVIDNGTCSIKTGFAGSSKPKVRILE